jgi:hypothetical protein
MAWSKAFGNRVGDERLDVSVERDGGVPPGSGYSVVDELVEPDLLKVFVSRNLAGELNQARDERGELLALLHHVEEQLIAFGPREVRVL